MSETDKLTVMISAVQEAARLRGTPVVKEWTGTKALQQLLTNSEYESLMLRLIELSVLKTAIPTPIIAAGAHAGELPPYDIEVNLQNVNSYKAPLELENTTLRIGDQRIKLSRGSHHFTLQYMIVVRTLKKPMKPVEETSIMAALQPGYEITARRRAVFDATRKLNAKINAATGIEKLFEYSAGHVVYRPDRLL